MSDISHTPRKRAPAGVVVKRPLHVYLLPDELAAFNRLHADTSLTRSALARQVHLIGMQIMATDPSRVPRRGS